MRKTDFKFTNPLSRKLNKFKWENSLLVDDEEKNWTLQLACRKLKGTVKLTSKRRANVYDILRMDKLIIHKDSIPHLVLRTKPGEKVEIKPRKK